MQRLFFFKKRVDVIDVPVLAWTSKDLDRIHKPVSGHER
jgi:hypothetical protein